MSEIRIAGSRLSPFVEKVASAFEYKKVPFILEEVSPLALRRLNPVTGKMPVLLEGTRAPCYDSTRILRRLEVIAPEPPLASADPQIAAAQRQLEDWSDESLYWLLMALRWCPRNEAASAAELSDALPAALRPFARPLVRRLVGGQTRAQGFGRLPYGVLMEELTLRLDDLVLLLGPARFFYASRPSIADFALYGQLRFACRESTPDVSERVAERAALADWMKRVEDAARG